MLRFSWRIALACAVLLLSALALLTIRFGVGNVALGVAWGGIASLCGYAVWLALHTPRQAWLPMVAIAMIGCLFALPAQAATIDVGAALGSTLGPYVNALVEALITALVGWVLYLVKSKLNVSIDDSARAAVETWLKNQASSLVADGAVAVNGLKVTVSSDALAAAANTALKLIPDAVARFGLTPDVLRQKIVDAIPHVPSVAAVAAAQVTPAPIVNVAPAKG